MAICTTRRFRRLFIGWILAVVAVQPAAAADSDAIAYVNGAPIGRVELVDLLMDAHGLSGLQQLIMLRLAKQHTHRLGLKVTAADVQAEFDRTLDRITENMDLGDRGLGEVGRQRALENVLTDRGVTLAEFMLGMERNAHLRAAAKRGLVLDDATVREEFARTYGEQVRVRHIEVMAKNHARIHEVQAALDRGEDFQSVARRLSENVETGPRGGELTPFSFDDERVDPVVREAAFSMARGEVSAPLRVGNRFHIIRLEERIAPRSVEFADVRDEVANKLRERILPERMATVANELFEQAQIEVLNRSLRQQYQALLDRNERIERIAEP